MANVIKHKRGSGSDPSASNLVVGELAIRTDTGKLFTKMDSGALAEIAGGGSDIAINTLSSSSGTGGGSATFNGSAYRFTLSSPPSVSAAQLLVSINGVIQKPVAGTGQPSEGFSVDGNDIILGDAPATGSDFFILTFRSLGVSVPADNSVTSAKIVDGAIVNDDINASAAIAGTKISPDFGSQNISTTGTLSLAAVAGTNTNAALNVLFQTSAGVIDGGSGLTYNPGGDSLSVNGNFINANTFRGDGNLGRLTCDNHSSTTTVDVSNTVNILTNDNVTDAFSVKQGSNEYITVDTNNSSELITLGNTTTNPKTAILGGNVGIGTTSPATILHISQTNPELRIQGTNGNGGVHKIFSAGINSESLQLTGASNLLFNADTQFFRSSDEGTEYMRIDSSGRLLLGTTTAGTASADNLVIADSADCGITIRSGSSSGGNLFFTDLSSGDQFQGYVQYDHGVNALAFGTQKIARMRIDSSGRVGIGCTPTAQFDHNLIQVGNQATLGANAALSTTGQTFLTHNLYFDPSGNYQVFNTSNANEGTILRMFDGNFTFSNSPQTTGTPTVTERMRIDSSGRVLIGQTSGSSPLCVSGTDPVIAELHHSDGGTNDQARISLGALANNPPSNRGVNLIAKNNGAGHDFVVACSASHSAGPTERVRVTSAGHLFHNCTSFPSSSDPGTAIIKDGNQGEIRIATNSTAQAVLIRLINPNGIVGDIRTSGSGIIINGTSDYRVKENAVAISDGISRIKTLKPYRFNFKADPTKTLDGFFAHEVTAVPEAITGTKDEVASEDDDSLGVKQGDPIYQGIDQSKLVPLLVAALQEAIGRIEALEAK